MLHVAARAGRETVVRVLIDARAAVAAAKMEAAARAAFEDADRRYSALKGIEKRLEDELARLRVEEAALRAAAGEVDEEGWAQFDPARDGGENLEAV